MRAAAPLHCLEAFISDAGHELLFSFFLCWCQFFARRCEGPLFRGRSLEDAGAGAGHGHGVCSPWLAGQPFTRRVGSDAAGPVRYASDARSDGACPLFYVSGSVPRAQRLIKAGPSLKPPYETRLEKSCFSVSHGTFAGTIEPIDLSLGSPPKIAGGLGHLCLAGLVSTAAQLTQSRASRNSNSNSLSQHG